nr:IS701 family transposase [Kineosporia babensis]
MGDVRDWTVEHLGDERAILVVDETGDLKKGVHTVGVQRQHTGTAGRIENAQVTVYLAYASERGHALMDRELYLPKAWTEDPEQMEAAGVPAGTAFATKPALARQMIERTIEAGVPADWATGDEVYGQDPALRAALQRLGLGYMLAVAKDHQIRTGIGLRRAIDLAVRLPAATWQRLSAGQGAHGHRWYDWALIDTIDEETAALHDDSQESPPTAPSVRHWSLIRRNRGTGEYAFYRAYSPEPVPLRTLVLVAGRRWTIEESFAAGKELTGLDEHQVRSWTSWRRWSALAILAHAFLSVTAATQNPPATTQPDTTTESMKPLIALTRNEIRRLLTSATTVLKFARHALHWSSWRRRHQAIARTSHYKKTDRNRQSVTKRHCSTSREARPTWQHARMNATESLRRFGFHPAPGDLQQIRELLQEQSELNDEQDTILMRVLSLQLFNAANAPDILAIWRAKASSFDAYSAIDVQLLCGPGLEATHAYLTQEGSPHALDARQYLDECIATGDFEDFSPDRYGRMLNASFA